ncbi:hypothetical protein ZYGR_0AS05240 [Zygosaccharomyces rouxii]|uniref:Uncharacterized protein n=1 Tax=Zygosaccharomyces rouxii TaxID=4956 RepID=A0A1Q3AHT5_ZYGRO|nr:hypothetical protein ZYGR_0AS05240 [Zygosaccharomyces rouxii]
MPQKSLCQTLDVTEDFVRPRSITLTSEELQNIPPPKRHNGPHLEKLIKINLKDTGIVRGWTRIRRAFGVEELGKNMAKNEKGDRFKPKYSKPLRSLNSPIIAYPGQTPKIPNSKEKSMLDGSAFSPQPSMNTVPSPSMHASISTPEYTNSEVESSGDAFSDISSFVESLKIGSREHRLTSPRQLKRTVIQPRIFEFGDEDDDEDDDDDDGRGIKELQEKIEMLRLPPIDH